MGLDVWLVDERGGRLKEVPDEGNELARASSGFAEGRYSLLSGIDRYADTIFNSQQMSQFLAEWDQFSSLPGSPRLRSLVARIRELAEMCASVHHTYLKFVGD